MAKCECPVCGRVFSGLTTFDKHQDVDHDRKPVVTCHDPVTVGLVVRDGVWHLPGRIPTHALAVKKGEV